MAVLPGRLSGPVPGSEPSSGNERGEIMKNQDSGASARFVSTVTTVSRWFEWLGLAGFALMSLTALVDVVGTKLFGLPLPGSTEITSVLQIMAIGAGLAFSQIDGKQIRVDIIMAFLPKPVNHGLDILASVLGMLFFALAAWMLYEMGTNLSASGTKTLLLGIPLAPFAFWLGLCCIPMCCAILMEFVSAIRGLTE
jgi:TRAP-type C4-dicarboxylate transport system permease small subunit